MNTWYKVASDFDMEAIKPGSWAGRIVFHGTDMESAEDIVQNGVDMSKASGGYFGFGFYTTPDKILAKSNYADFGREDGEAAVVELVIKPNARILDMRDEEDSAIYMRVSQNGRNIGFSSFPGQMVAAGADGLFDRSFDGVVIYNPAAVKVVGLA